MRLNFLNRKSLSWVILQHERNQVLELLREIALASSFVGGVALPEDIWSVHVDFVVELICERVCSVEWRMASHHDEQNDPSSE